MKYVPANENPSAPAHVRDCLENAISEITVFETKGTILFPPLYSTACGLFHISIKVIQIYNRNFPLNFEFENVRRK